MNLVTVCKFDLWVLTQLRRFVYFAKKNMPEASLFIVLVVDQELSSLDKSLVEEQMSPYFEGVAFVQEELLEGHLLFYDKLRAGLLEIFHLDECLYLDVDIDIVSDLSDIPTLSPEPLLWVGGLHVDPNVHAGLIPFGLEEVWPQVRPGAFYFRKSYVKEFDKVMRSPHIATSHPYPGSVIWNVIKSETSHFQIPFDYHATVWEMENLFSAKMVHFCGELPKLWRLYCRYEGDPKRLFLSKELCDYPDVDFSALPLSLLQPT